MAPRGRVVEFSDRSPRPPGAEGQAVGTEAAVIDHQSGPAARVLGVVRVWRLEPGSGKTEIQVDGVRVVGLEIQPVEQVLLIAMIVEDLIFRAIEETAGDQPARRDEVSPGLLPIRQIDAFVGTAESAVGSRYIPVGRSHSKSGAG